MMTTVKQRLMGWWQLSYSDWWDDDNCQTAIDGMMTAVIQWLTRLWQLSWMAWPCL